MGGGAAAGGAAAAAAAAAAARARAEEEEMTSYGPGDLEGWEFKILRSATSKFKKPEMLRHALDEEAGNGWELVEKFDDSRIRLKRKTEHRDRDRGAHVDPYRTFVGTTPNQLAAWILCGVFGFVLVIVLIVVIAES